jgi:hypothetical protein
MSPGIQLGPRDELLQFDNSQMVRAGDGMAVNWLDYIIIFASYNIFQLYKESILATHS